MDNKLVIGIGAAGVAAVTLGTAVIVGLVKDCKAAKGAGMTLKEYRQARKNQLKAAEAKAKGPAPVNPANATIVA
jgi:hypothetical protein